MNGLSYVLKVKKMCVLIGITAMCALDEAESIEKLFLKTFKTHASYNKTLPNNDGSCKESACYQERYSLVYNDTSVQLSYEPPKTGITYSRNCTELIDPTQQAAECHETSVLVGDLPTNCGTYYQDNDMDIANMSRTSNLVCSGPGYNDCRTRIHYVSHDYIWLMMKDKIIFVESSSIRVNYNYSNILNYDCQGECTIPIRDRNGDYFFKTNFPHNNNKRCYCSFTSNKFYLTAEISHLEVPIYCMGNKVAIGFLDGVSEITSTTAPRDLMGLCKFSVVMDGHCLTISTPTCQSNFVKIFFNHQIIYVKNLSDPEEIICVENLKKMRTGNLDVTLYGQDFISKTFSMKYDNDIDPCSMIDCIACDQYINNPDCHTVLGSISIVVVILSSIIIVLYTCVILLIRNTKRVAKRTHHLYSQMSGAKIQGEEVIEMIEPPIYNSSDNNQNDTSFSDARMSSESEIEDPSHRPRSDSSSSSLISISDIITPVKLRKRTECEERNKRSSNFSEDHRKEDDVILQLEKEIVKESETTAQKKKSIYPNLLNLFLILSILITMSSACSTYIPVKSSFKQCTLTSGKIMSCKFTSSINFELSSAGQEMCLKLEGFGQSHLGVMKLKVKSVFSVCQERLRYYTFQPRVVCNSHMNCFESGKCEDTNCEEVEAGRSKKVPFDTGTGLYKDTCVRVPGSLLNGCFHMADGCSFVRKMVKNADTIVYKVFTCDSWKTMVTLEEQFTPHMAKTVTKIHVLETMIMDSSIPNIQIMITHINKPFLDISKCFIKLDDTNVAEVSCSEPGQFENKAIGEVQCPTLGTAKDPNTGCIADFQKIRTVGDTINQKCISEFTDIQQHTKSKRLPLLHHGYHFNLNSGNVIMEHDYMDPITINMDLKDFDVTALLSTGSISTYDWSLTGCVNCKDGATLSFNYEASEDNVMLSLRCDSLEHSFVLSKGLKSQKQTIWTSEQPKTQICTIIHNEDKQMILLNSNLVNLYEIMIPKRSDISNDNGPMVKSNENSTWMNKLMKYPAYLYVKVMGLFSLSALTWLVIIAVIILICYFSVQNFFHQRNLVTYTNANGLTETRVHFDYAPARRRRPSRH